MSASQKPRNAAPLPGGGIAAPTPVDAPTEGATTTCTRCAGSVVYTDGIWLHLYRQAAWLRSPHTAEV